jgi:hypothetical protein
MSAPAPEPDPLPATVVTFLTSDPRIERCPLDTEYARITVERVITEECEDCLHAAAQGRWRKANTYSYDGARKCVEAWLLACGWRVRAAPGAHAAVGEIVRRWLEGEPSPGPRLASSFSASRKARHDDEYPSPRAFERTDRELRALVLDNGRLINRLREAFHAAVIPGIVPTEAVLEQRPER